ncbi:MFS transporter [Amycolatopsis jejuensis]|uniref:MFS transporter n=1 Tax=Amycolatopsis jejuensis TaxID=330084 RepID=UPI0009FE95DE|nr:MFS transporter [Amycolatopsis jejuensis]
MDPTEPVSGTAGAAGTTRPADGEKGWTALTGALDSMGVTRAHKTILFLVLAGGFFDVWEQDSIGAVGPNLQQAWHISTTQIGLLVTATLFAMVVGGIVAGMLGDVKGRRYVIVANLALYSLGALVCALAPNLAVLMIGRVVVGIGLGGELAIGITLLAEVSPTKFRASSVAMYNVGAGGLGNPTAYGFGALVLGVFGEFFGGTATSWRWFYGLLVIPGILILYYRRYLPESPRYLLSKGRVQEANLVLSRLANGNLRARDIPVTPYLSEGASAVPEREKVRFREIFSRRLLRGTLTVGIAAWMTFGAQNIVLSLLPTVLSDEGYDIANSLLFTMVINFGGLLGAIAASYLGYRVRRRMVAIPGGIIACIAAIGFGLARGSVAIILAGFAFQFFVLTLNTTIWAWSPELFPTRIRAFGTSVLLAVNLSAGAILVPIAGGVFTGLGKAGLFGMVAVMYGVMTCLAVFAPETHGRPLNEDAAHRAA